MKVKCITKKEKQISKDNYSVNNTREYLKIGETYNVYGIFFYQGVLNYLIVGGHGKGGEYGSAIFWEPAELFEIVDGRLPPEWYYNCAGKDFPKDKLIDPSYAIWGYKELAEDILHSDRLMEREVEDLKIFFKRKHEIDEWIEMASM